MKKILVTGGCGFLGHHFVEHVLKNTDWQVVVLDGLNYASRGYDRLRDIGIYDDKRVSLFCHDITRTVSVGLERELGKVNIVAHIAAETHVDHSIANPRVFVYANVVGTLEVLEMARRMESLEKFVYFSTDEVFGPAGPDENFKEWDRYNSTNPYSATKAGAEELCLAYANSYKLPIFITHCMNLFGERQHPEKFIPNTIRKILNGEVVSIHADSSRQRAGSRFYLHCRNASDAVFFLLSNSDTREKYNIVGEQELDNLTLAGRIAHIIGKPWNYEMVDFHSSRPGHDLRYGLDGSKLASMGWKPPVGFDQSLEKTIRWFLDHPKWLED